jgi:hypothetical protein
MTTTESENMCHEMFVPIGDSLSDIRSSDDGDDGQDEHDADSEQGVPIADDKPCWVMGTIIKTVQQCIYRCRQKQMKLDQLV